MNLSPKVRNILYGILVLVNVSLTAAAQQKEIPEQYAHWVTLASLIVAMFMKEIFVKDPSTDGNPNAN